MQPTPPDPITAALNLQRIPNRVKVLTQAFRRTNREAKRFPEWREYQILSFIKFAGIYAIDLNETYRAGRLDSLSQAMRNLLELSIWTQYCGVSTENAKHFFDDAARDIKEIMEVLQKVYTTVNKEPQKRIEDILIDMKSRAPQLNIENLDDSYTRVSDAAEAVGKRFAHSPFYKIASKFAHPTSLILNLKDSQGNLKSSFYEIGSKLVTACLDEVEKTIRSEYPRF
jgi:hypothetical protein